jgi:hypothetical protein
MQFLGPIAIAMNKKDFSSLIGEKSEYFDLLKKSPKVHFHFL